MARTYDDGELLDHLRALAEDLGGSPTEAQMDDLGPVSASTYKRRFGSWNDALRAAGLAVNRERDIPAADLLAELHRLAEELGRVPLAVDVRSHGRYSLDPYVDRFDSWSDALVEAGFAVRRASTDASDAVAYLRRHGPCRVDALPGGAPDTAAKLQGAATFELGSGSLAVGYLLDEHDERDVARAFLAANPGLPDEHARHNLLQLFGTQGRRWRDAARAALDDLPADRDDTMSDR